MTSSRLLPPPSRPARAVARGVLTVVLGVGAAGLAGCSSGSSSGSSSSGSSPVATPTGSPFSATLTGPETGEAGQVVTAVLTNTGRLPDSYRLVADPAGAVEVAVPDQRLGPQESVEVELRLVRVPAIVRVESSSVGMGGAAASLSIGARASR